MTNIYYSILCFRVQVILYFHDTENTKVAINNNETVLIKQQRIYMSLFLASLFAYCICICKTAGSCDLFVWGQADLMAEVEQN